MNAANCAEQAGNAIASNLLNDMIQADNQALRAALFKSAIVNLATLQHNDRAAAGFAVGSLRFSLGDIHAGQFTRPAAPWQPEA